MDCKLCAATDLPLFYTQGDRRQFRFYRCPRCRFVVYDMRSGVNQEKYILAAVDPDAPTRQNRGHRQTYAFFAGATRRATYRATYRSSAGRRSRSPPSAPGSRSSAGRPTR